MKNAGRKVLKALLFRLPEKDRASLEKHLSSHEKKELDALHAPTHEAELESPSMLDLIHWSWFLPILRTSSLDEQKLFLSALPESSSHPLSHELGLPSPPAMELKRPAKAFLIQTLLHNLLDGALDIVPIGFLPPSPLNPLLLLTKKKLLQLIDFLSLFDLATELKQILDPATLKNIYRLLSEEEKRFLKHTASSPLALPAIRLQFEGWNGDETTFRTQLHKRGLARLGAALSTQEADLGWYLCHQLDIGRGTTLANFSTKPVPMKIGQTIIHQIEEALHYEGVK